MRVETTEPQPSQPPPTGPERAEADQLLAQVFPSYEGRTRAETEQALRDFQTLRGLEPHGRLDRDTLDQLRRAADWIQHEKNGGEPAPVAASRRPPARPALDTHHALLAKNLDAKVGSEASSRSHDRAIQLELRAPSHAERVILAGLVGAMPTWQHLRDLAVELGKTIVVGAGVDGTLATGRGAASAGVYFGPNGEIGLTGSAGAGWNLTQPAGGSLTSQVMVLDGGIDMLRGRSVTVGAAVGVGGLAGGASVVLDEQTMRKIGVCFELGGGAGWSPLDAYYQGNWGERNEPVVPE